MRIARLFADEKPLGSVPIQGKLPRVITWSGNAYVRMRNSYRYKRVTTIDSKVLLDADFTTHESDDLAQARDVAQRLRKTRE